jgi:hypothetical protein
MIPAAAHRGDLLVDAAFCVSINLANDMLVQYNVARC